LKKRNIIGDRLYNLRTKAGLTIKGLHEATGISEGHISGMENGSSFPSMKKLTILCEFYGLTLVEFFIDDGLSIALTDKQRELIKLSDTLTEEQIDSLNVFLRNIYNNEKTDD